MRPPCFHLVVWCRPFETGRDQVWSGFPSSHSHSVVLSKLSNSKLRCGKFHVLLHFCFRLLRIQGGLSTQSIIRDTPNFFDMANCYPRLATMAIESIACRMNAASS